MASNAGDDFANMLIGLIKIGFQLAWDLTLRPAFIYMKFIIFFALSALFIWKGMGLIAPDIIIGNEIVNRMFGAVSSVPQFSGLEIVAKFWVLPWIGKGIMIFAATSLGMIATLMLWGKFGSAWRVFAILTVATIIFCTPGQMESILSRQAIGAIDNSTQEIAALSVPLPDNINGYQLPVNEISWPALKQIIINGVVAHGNT